jgi:hypothetical protein
MQPEDCIYIRRGEGRSGKEEIITEKIFLGLILGKPEIFATEIIILDRFLNFKFMDSHSCKSWLSAASNLGDLLHSLITVFDEDESNARACHAVMSKI